jgi:hypothetical protein
MIRAILVILLALFLTACSMGGGPSKSMVEKAIALQLTQVQQDLGPQLYATTAELPQFRVNRVKITKREPLMIENLRSYRVQGTYDVTSIFRDRKVTQRQNPFEVYVQWQSDNKTWELAHLPADKGE